MIKEHIGIFIPGIGNSNKVLEQAINRLQRPGFRGVIYDAQWKDGEENFQPKLDQLVGIARGYKREGHNVSIVGMSAGGVLGVIASHEMKEDVAATVAICARLRLGGNAYPWQETILNRNPSHKKAVAHFETQIEPQMTKEERDKILTIRPFVDEIVPPETMTIRDAHNERIVMIEHTASIYAALTIYSGYMMNFLRVNRFYNMSSRTNRTT